jgi:hypothetical protein
MKSFLAVAMLIIATGAHATTFYASPSGSGSTCSYSSPCTLASGVPKLASGDTLVLEDGTYSSGTISSIANGTSGAYTTIQAANDGGAILTADSALNLTSVSYIQLIGLKLNYTGIKQITGPADGSAPSSHIKILRCAFQGGTTSGSNSHNFYFSYSNYLLIEDCWFYGLGGRYTLATQSSDNVVLRRVVVRKDGGWPGDSGSDQEAAVAVYNSSNVVLQNVLILDCQATYSSAWMTSLYFILNSGTSTHATDSNSVTGSIILNGYDRGIMITPAVTNTTVSNMVIANIINDSSGSNIARYIHTKGEFSVSTTTMLQYPATSETSQYGVYSDGGSGSVTTAIVADLAGGTDYYGVSSTVSDSYGNSSSSAAYSYNPYTNGLLYLPRVETSSTLQTAGIGAQNITTRIGTSGTLWGETGYNTDTGVALWPWPNEDRIKIDMASVSNRGFTAYSGKDGIHNTLTSYIWESLGNQIPSGIYGSGTAYFAPWVH